jgi:hypothetical protein
MKYISSFMKPIFLSLFYQWGNNFKNHRVKSKIDGKSAEISKYKLVQNCYELIIFIKQVSLFHI